MVDKRSASYAGSANANRQALAVEGARTLRAALKKAEADIQGFKETHAAVAAQVAATATYLAPWRTGRLAGSIRPSGTQAAAIVRAGRASIPYAGPIHWGWPGHHIKAQPFMAIAAEQERPWWTAEYMQTVDRIVNEIKGAPGP